MNYTESLEYLASLAPRGWRLGLDRMEEFVRRAGLDSALGAQGQPHFIHIAGTNGKGSTTAFVQNILLAHGFRTGGFFSPFVYDIRERVQMNAKLIPEADFARIITELKPIGEGLADTEFGGITEFELKTAVGFQYWREQKAEWVALEVGLGGKLDATNVVTPSASIIVSIGLDHTAILGETLGEIAAEKAGVIKRGVPVVVGNMQEEALEPIRRRALECNSRMVFGSDLPYGFEPGIPGEHIKRNAALATAALEAAGLELDPRLVQRAIAETKLPGRFQEVDYKGKRFILDGAHNKDAARALSAILREKYAGDRFTMIAGMVRGHEPDSLFQELGSLASSIYLPPIDYHRAYRPEELLSSLTKHGETEMKTCQTIAEAINAALEDESDYVLVTGSFYLVGEVGRLLGS